MGGVEGCGELGIWRVRCGRGCKIGICWTVNSCELCFEMIKFVCRVPGFAAAHKRVFF